MRGQICTGGASDDIHACLLELFILFEITYANDTGIRSEPTWSIIDMYVLKSTMNMIDDECTTK
jgi:hypothetical protein